MNLSRLLTLTSLACGIACAPAAAPEVVPGGPGSEVVVRIENRGWTDVVVSVYAGGIWERLGTATATKTVNFSVPWRKFDSGGVVSFRADPANGGAPVYTESLLLAPGKLVVWTLQLQLEQSSVAVY
jgi:hypothetical protein